MSKYLTPSPVSINDIPYLRIVEETPLYDGHAPAKRKRSTGRFAMVPEQVRALKDIYALGVYSILAFHFNDQDECWPSFAAIASELNISRPTVIKAIKKLVDAGVITSEPRQSVEGDPDSNLYRRVVLGGKGDLLPSKPDLPGVVKDVYPNKNHYEQEEKELLRSSKKKPSKIPPYDFQPTAEMIEWATAKGFSQQMIERETEKFRNKEFHRAYTDWNKVWKNWFLADWVRPDENPQTETQRKYKMNGGVWN